MGVAAAELGPVGPGDPVQQPAGVVEALVGAHEVEHGPGMLDQVLGKADGGGEGLGPDGLGPAVAEMAGWGRRAISGRLRVIDVAMARDFRELRRTPREVRALLQSFGRENVVAGTDCGLGLRVHQQIVWAKLKVEAEGAAMATKNLWK